MAEDNEGESSKAVLGSCHYKEELHIVSIKDVTSLMELYLSIARRWDGINPQKFNLQYKAPHERLYVTLMNDEDVSNMVLLHLSLKMNIVELVVSSKDDPVPIGRARSVRSSVDERSSCNASQSEESLARSSIDGWKQCIFGEGQTFKDANEFRVMLKNYAVGTRRSFIYKKNDNKKIIVVCSDENCKWRIYGSRHSADKLFGIRNCILEHTCGEDNLRTRGHPKADSTWVANLVKDKLRGEPSYRPVNILKDIHREYGVELGYHKAWMGKEIAMHEIYGAEKGSYDKLRWYCNAVRKTNPGSIAEYEVDPVNQKFCRLFICFAACLLGFLRGCRPLIFLDGTHIKNKYKGCLLSAVSKDANDDLFTIAYAIVDAENDSNWEWFCFKLRSVLDSQYIPGVLKYTFFSDRHPGLLKAIPLVFPGSHHAYCLRHLVDNFKKQVLRSYPLHNKKHWALVFMKAAYAPTRQEFERHIDNILESMPRARDFIMQSEPQCWANALFPGDRWGVINNNQAECWNSWVKPARFMPVAAMIDHIRKQIMVMMHERREESQKMVGQLCPKQEQKLAVNYKASRSLRVSMSSGFSFEVIDSDMSYAVDLQGQTCSCRAWQVDKMPCKHACACIETKSLSPYDFTDPSYRVEMYKQSYQGVINPIPTFETDILPMNDDVLINAPDCRSQPGRRRTQRIPSQVEKKIIKCRRCGRVGHNRRSCKESIG